jgi:cytochrome c oxidase assembly protein subunit 15
MTSASPGRVGGIWLHRYAVFVASATFFLIIAGGLVTSTGSGLAVPDWPLSFGQVFPRMEGGVLFEHGHRLIAATVGLLTVVLAVWAARSDVAARVRTLGWALVGVVVLQGVLGGTTVLLRLPSSVSVAHAGLAQIFFALTVLMAAATSPASPARGTAGADPGAPSVRAMTALGAVAVYLQILIGAVVRHIGAGMVIPDWPLSFGRLVPTITNSLVAWQYAHRTFALAVAALVVWTCGAVLARFRDQPLLARPASALLALIVIQVLLGGLTIWSVRAVVPTTTHVAVGALVFVTAVLLAARTRHAVASEPGPAAVAADAPLP